MNVEVSKLSLWMQEYPSKSFALYLFISHFLLFTVFHRSGCIHPYEMEFFCTVFHYSIFISFTIKYNCQWVEYKKTVFSLVIYITCGTQRFVFLYFTLIDEKNIIERMCAENLSNTVEIVYKDIEKKKWFIYLK